MREASALSVLLNRAIPGPQIAGRTSDTALALFFVNTNIAHKSPAILLTLMATLEMGLSLIEEYALRYNVRFDITPPYDLFPEDASGYSISTNQWPGNLRSGVYLILNSTFEIIYIGQSTSLGRRFSEYFNSRGGKCEIIHPHSWNGLPRYIVSVVVPKSDKHIRLSLEEYLIEKLNPIDNIKGKSE